MTSLDEKFIDFCKSESSGIFGGVNDTFSIEQIKKFNSNLQSQKIDKQADFINDEIANVKQIEENIRKMREKFEKLSDKNNGTNAVITNSFPFGNIDDDNKQEFIDDTTLKQLTESEDKFSELSRILFQIFLKMMKN
jgi:predicted transcriptional regulator